MNNEEKTNWSGNVEKKDNVVHILGHSIHQEEKLTGTDNPKQNLLKVRPTQYNRRFNGHVRIKKPYIDKILESNNEINSPLHEGDDDMSDEYKEDFKMIKKDLRDSEIRISQDIRDRERRFERSMEKFSEEAKERENRMMKMVERIENKTDQAISRIEDIKTQNFWGNIALFVGMLAVVITLIVSL